MKKIVSCCALLIATQLFVSCSDLTSKPESAKQVEDKEDFKVVTVNDEYEMSVPDYMKESKDLNADASLQYLNLFKEVYVVVIDEGKDSLVEQLKQLDEYKKDSSGVENYRDFQISLIKERAEVKGPTPSTGMKINGLNAELVEFRAAVEGVPADIAYFVLFVESKEKFYMVMAWTLYERKDKYREDFLTMFNSFKTVKKRRESSEPGA